MQERAQRLAKNDERHACSPAYHCGVVCFADRQKQEQQRLSDVASRLLMIAASSVPAIVVQQASSGRDVLDCAGALAAAHLAGWAAVQQEDTKYDDTLYFAAGVDNNTAPSGTR
jgi:hypothetical protein